VSGLDFQLHTLGWRAFSDLCQTVLREVLGQHLQAFSDVNDGGRDGAFHGPATPVAEGCIAGLHGEVVAQVKHTSVPGGHLSLADVQVELVKAERLATAGLCDTYVLLTNALVTGAADEAIRGALADRGVATPLLLGGEWLTHTIRESARLRSLVPRLYGLGDLSQILDSRAYEQARALLDSRRDELATFVPTAAYRRAEAALHDHGFVLLLGEPGAGKSVIAATLSAAAADKWDSAVVEAAHPNDIRHHWNPKERTLFWADDAFGVMHFDERRMDAWNRTLGLKRSMVRGGSRVVLTSRDYIWNAARRHLKESAFPFLLEDQVVINVEELSQSEREDILYSHLRHGQQPLEVLTDIKPFLREISAEVALLPESARRLADPFFTKDLNTKDPAAILHFLTHPAAYLREVLRQLDADSEAAVALVFAYGQHLSSPLSLTPYDLSTIAMLGATPAGVRRALTDLQGSLVAFDSGEGHWRFRHPSVADGFAALLVEDPEKLAIYLRGAPVDRLLAEATVGTVDLEGAAVTVPPQLFGLLRQRLNAVPPSEREQLWEFLATRCTAEFARTYLEARPDMLRPLTHPGMFLGEGRPEVRLLRQLHVRGALPDSGRLDFIDHVVQIAVEGPDPAWCASDSVRAVIGDDGYARVRAAVRMALVSEPDELRASWDTSNYPGLSWGTPDAWTQELSAAAEAYASEFAGDAEAVAAAKDLAEFGEDLTRDLYEDHPEVDRDDEDWRPRSKGPRPSGAGASPPSVPGRDVFDDLDAR
jgi:hypothetical protein